MTNSKTPALCLTTFESALALHDCDPRQDGQGEWPGRAYCPVCFDHELTLNYTSDHRGVAFRCHSAPECTKEPILLALGLKWGDLLTDARPVMAELDAQFLAGNLKPHHTLAPLPEAIKRQSVLDVAEEVRLVFGLYRGADWTGSVMLTGEFLSPRLADGGVTLTPRAVRAALSDLTRARWITFEGKTGLAKVYREGQYSKAEVAQTLEEPEEDLPEDLTKDLTEDLHTEVPQMPVNTGESKEAASKKAWEKYQASIAQKRADSRVTVEG